MVGICHGFPVKVWMVLFVFLGIYDMRKISVVLAVMMCLAGCINEKIEGADLKVGDMIPDFEVVMDDGSVISDDILKESVSVVMFFHTSCPDCQQVLPEMQKIYDKYASQGVNIALISREESEMSINAFWEKKCFNMPYSAQNGREVYLKFARERIPRVYVCEKGGIIRYMFTDNPNPSYDDIMSSLESLIRKRGSA